MRFVDVNLLVYAHRPESVRHDDYAAWLDAARRGPEPLALSDIVVSGFVRIVTHSRVYSDPTPTPVALDFGRALRSSPAVLAAPPGPHHWAIFEHLCRDSDARGNDIPDAFLAAIAIESGATFWTADRALRRFDGLEVRHPLSD